VNGKSTTPHPAPPADDPGPGSTGGPYSRAEEYRRLGWTGTIPLDLGAKTPPPSGVTGDRGRMPTADDIHEWRATGWVTRGDDDKFVKHRAGNLALRLPPIAIGLDVDDYDDKQGAATLAARETQWGPLPSTWRSTSRDDGVSGIRFFRIPAGLHWPNVVGPGIEIIRHGHRYAVAWPSLHPDGGVYQWLDPAGERCPIPAFSDLPELPTEWVAGLTGGALAGEAMPNGSLSADRADRRNGRAWLAQLPGGEPCPFVAERIAVGLAAARREMGSAYDGTRDAMMSLLRAGEAGHPGVAAGLATIRQTYVDTVQKTRGARSIAEGEFDRLAETGAALILGTPSSSARRGCTCAKPPAPANGHHHAAAQRPRATDEQPPQQEWAIPHPEQISDARILAGLYANRDAARAHFAEDPEEVDGNDPKPSPINVDTMLPRGMQPLVRGIVDHLQVPPEAPALMALSVLSTATGGHVVVDGRNGWRQPTILWTATTMHSGERKTDVVRLTSDPLRQVEDRLIAEHDEGVKSYKRDKSDLEDHEKDLKNELKGRPRDRAKLEGDLANVRQRLEELPDEPGPAPALLVEDFTPEALSSRLGENRQTLGVLSDEGGLFGLISGRYSKDQAPNLDLFLKSYDQSPARVDRIGRGVVMLTRPSLAIGLLVQPHVLEKAASIDGAMERGLMGRFLFATPESTLGRRAPDSPDFHAKVAEDWAATVAFAYALRAGDEKSPFVLGLDDDAYQLLRELRIRLEPHLEPVVGRYSHMTDWAGKFAGKVLRLAALFHLADRRPVTTPINADTMNRAVAFGVWSLKNAELIYAAWRTRPEDGAPGVAYVLAWLQRTGRTDFTTRDIQQAAKRTTWYTKDALNAALCQLVRARLLSSYVRVNGSGRQESTGLFIVRGAA
jgi:hypothetical protein